VLLRQEKTHIRQKATVNISVYAHHIIIQKVAIVRHVHHILIMVSSCFVLKVYIQAHRKKGVCVLSASYIVNLLLKVSIFAQSKYFFFLLMSIFHLKTSHHYHNHHIFKYRYINIVVYYSINCGKICQTENASNEMHHTVVRHGFHPNFLWKNGIDCMELWVRYLSPLGI